MRTLRVNVGAVESTPPLAAARDAGRAIHTRVPVLTSQLELLVDFLLGCASSRSIV